MLSSRCPLNRDRVAIQIHSTGGTGIGRVETSLAGKKWSLGSVPCSVRGWSPISDNVTLNQHTQWSLGPKCVH